MKKELKKLVSVFDGDIDELLNKANELLDASKEYKNFSGIADGMDGSVKFIFVSEKIKYNKERLGNHIIDFPAAL